MIVGALTLFSAAALAQAQAPAPRVLAADASQSSFGYTIVHKFHKVRGESKSVSRDFFTMPDRVASTR